MADEDHAPACFCLERALRLYLQQAPVDVLVEELKASATEACGSAADHEAGPSLPPWTSLGFQERVAATLLDSPVAEEFPPRLEYVSRVTKLLLQEVEAAGDEPAEGLLLARMACASSLRAREEGMMAAGGADNTAFESFWFPRPAVSCDGSSSRSNDGFACVPLADSSGTRDTQKDTAGAFFSFRVANRDNEVGLRVWEAGRALAEFCLAHSDLLEGKRVLELGAGIGMTGMAAAACCGAKEVVLTDYAPRVLANLHYNVEINRPLLDTGKRESSNGSNSSGPANAENTALPVPPPPPPPHADVSVRFLDWTDYCQHDGAPLPISPATRVTKAGAKTASASTGDTHPAAVAAARAAALSPSTPPPPPPACTCNNGNGVTGVESRGGASGTVSVSASAAGGESCSPSGSRQGRGGGVTDDLLPVRSSYSSSGTGGGGGGVGGDDDPLGIPEVVLAADVVYDIKYHPALVGVVVETLRRCPDALVLFASTLRNSKTMAAFHRCLEDAGVPWTNVPFPTPPVAAARTKTGASVAETSPPFREEAEYRATATAAAGGGSHGCANAWRRSDADSAPLWCHPGDLERVKFCVCGRGAGLLASSEPSLA